MNSINIIFPYDLNGVLMFDDEKKGIFREPFVAGADTVLRLMAVASKVSPKRFALLFSDQPFKEHTGKAEWVSGDASNKKGTGNNYRVKVGKNWMACWLCPAMFAYFKRAPVTIYFQVMPQI